MSVSENTISKLGRISRKYSGREFMACLRRELADAQLVQAEARHVRVSLYRHLSISLSLGSSDKSNLELITLTCTCVAATLFWLLLTLFIRKLKRVRTRKKISLSCATPLFHVSMSIRIVIVRGHLSSHVVELA